MPKKLPPLHPGEVLLGLSAGALAKAIGVPRTRVERIAAESIGITADTALRLRKALGTSLCGRTCSTESASTGHAIVASPEVECGQGRCTCAGENYFNCTSSSGRLISISTNANGRSEAFNTSCSMPAGR
jgi:addiction module HigA family antidote